MTGPRHADRAVLAYDGSAAATSAIGWLASRGLDVVTLTVDVGQGVELLGIRERALAAGAARAHVLDVREEFARAFVLPLLQAGDPSLDMALAGAAEARTLLARRLLDVARMESAGAVAHGAGPGSPLDEAIRAAAAGLQVIYTPEAAVPGPTSTLIGRYLEAVPGVPLAGDAFALTRPRADCPREPAIVSIDIDAGVPRRENGIEMPLIELLESLETIAGAHGVGRREGVAPDGRTYFSEAPAATVLLAAYSALPRRGSGSVRLRLLNGTCTVET